MNDAAASLADLAARLAAQRIPLLLAVSVRVGVSVSALDV